MSDVKIPPGYRKNKYGYLVKYTEILDPVPKASRVAFKRPLSAHQRVMQALKQHQAIEAANAAPGDDSFDAPDLEGMTPHQLMTDPISGKEMTAGEHVMLQAERVEASKTVKQLKAKQAELSRRALAAKKEKKVASPPPEPEDDSGE